MESWEEILKQNFVLNKYHQRSYISPDLHKWFPGVVSLDWPGLTTEISAGPDIALKIDDISECLYCDAVRCDRLDRLSRTLE